MKLSLLSLSLAVALGASPLTVLQAQEEPEAPGVEDRAAVLRVDERVLYVLPEDAQGVLTALGARPAGEGKWTAVVRDRSGKNSAITFSLVETIDIGPFWPPDFSPGDPVPCPNPDIQVYKNSECNHPWLMQAGGCWNGTTGSSEYVGFDYRVCRRKVGGGGYCVNYQGTQGMTLYYSQPNCAGAPYSVVPAPAWICA